MSFRIFSILSLFSFLPVFFSGLGLFAPSSVVLVVEGTSAAVADVALEALDATTSSFGFPLFTAFLPFFFLLSPRSVSLTFLLPSDGAVFIASFASFSVIFSSFWATFSTRSLFLVVASFTLAAPPSTAVFSFFVGLLLERSAATSISLSLALFVLSAGLLLGDTTSIFSSLPLPLPPFLSFLLGLPLSVAAGLDSTTLSCLGDGSSKGSFRALPLFSLVVVGGGGGGGGGVDCVNTTTLPPAPPPPPRLPLPP